MIDVVEKLKQLEAAKFSEVCEKHTFECYRLRQDGCMQAVSVVILDGGPAAEGGARYYCHAESAEGKAISSSLEPTLDRAFASMRWSDLDPELAPEADAAAATETPEPEVAGQYDRRALFDRFRKSVKKKPA